VFGSRLRHCKAADPSNADAGRERNAVLIDVGSWWWYARGDPPRVRRTAGHPRGSRPGTRPGRRRGPRDGLWRLPERLARVGAGHGEWADDRVPADRCSATSPPAKWLPSATPSTGSRRATASSFRSRSATAPVRAVGRDTGTSVTTGERSLRARGARRVRRARRRPGRRLQPRRAPAVARRDRRGRARLPVHDRITPPRSGLDSTAASGWPSTVAAASGSRQSNWATRSGHGSSRSMSTTTPSRSLAIWGPTRL